MVCKFCGKEVHTEKYLHHPKGGVSCGECTSYCMKKCELGKSGKVQGWHFEPCLSCEKIRINGVSKMKLLFEFNIEKKKIVFFGNGFEISSPAETYEDIAKFAKDVIENGIGIPGLKHIEIEKKVDDNLQLVSLLLNCINNSNSKNYYVKKTGELYKGQIVLNCGKITDSFGNELIFI